MEESNTSLNTSLIYFFRNERTDIEGRMLDDILKFTPDKIENCHNFSLRIFPTKEKSDYNYYAPIIDDTFKETFQNDKLAKSNFCKSCQLYLNYIGFQCNNRNIICKPNSQMFHELPKHNLLRITRMLNSLNQIGNSKCSKQLYKLLRQETDLHPYKINDTTLHYWRLTQDEEVNNKNILLGTIAGNIIGSVYKFYPTKNIDFQLFSDSSYFTGDTVMTVANADWLITGDSLLSIMQDYGNRYNNVGYNRKFLEWLNADEPRPYNSNDSSSATRISPIGWAFDSLEETLKAAKQSAEVTHNHPEEIKGAQTIAACIYWARINKSKQEIKEYIEAIFGYSLDKTCAELRYYHYHDTSFQRTVSKSITAFLESTDYESAIRLAISLGGDTDTTGAITGGIAEAYYKEIPLKIREEIIKRIPDEFIDMLQKFYNKFIKK